MTDDDESGELYVPRTDLEPFQKSFMDSRKQLLSRVVDHSRDSFGEVQKYKFKGYGPVDRRNSGMKLPED